MKRQQAMELIMKRYRNQRLLSILTTWDENKTMDENALACKISSNYAYGLVTKYRLGFNRSSYNIRRVYKRKKSNRYISKWNPKLSLKGNAKRLGIGLSFASQIANAYGLSWTKEYKNGQKAIWTAKSFQAHLRAQMKSMRDSGVTLDRIGKVYGLTRERIRQILI